MIYDPFPTGERCCILPSDKLYKKNLRPNFKLERTSIGIFACIARGSHSSILLVKRQTKSECVTPCTRLGLNVL